MSKLAKRYNIDRTSYSFVCLDDTCKCYVDDIDEEIECPNCHKKIKARDSYTSQYWYESYGIWAFLVCENCHNKEIEQIKALMKELKMSKTKEYKKVRTIKIGD